MAILGGAKVADKIGVIENLLDQGGRADHRRRHGLHLPQGARAMRSAARCSTPTGRRCQAAAGAGRGAEACGSCCRSTWWSPTPSGPTPAAQVVPVDAHSRRTGRAWTSARRPGAPSPSASAARRRCSGTGPWASSRWRPFAAGHAGGGPGHGRVRARITHHRRRRLRRGGRADRARRQDDATSPPAAAPASSSWRAKSCPGRGGRDARPGPAATAPGR